MSWLKECLVIAEVAQAHDGSVGTAHAYIDAIADVGARAVKFQVHLAEAESSLEEPWRVKFSFQDETRFDYWKRMEFSEAQWRGLREHAKDRGLQFVCSPFSLEAVDLIDRVGGADIWKIASGEVSNGFLLKKIAALGKPVIVSSGMSSFAELEQALVILREKKLPYAVMQCTSVYPCPAEKLGLNVLQELREKYACAVGLSDHSAQIASSFAAVALGAKILELHVCFHKKTFGPDVSSSLTLEELAQVVQGVQFLEKALAHPVSKDQSAQELDSMRKLFTKSIVLKQPLSKGTALCPEHLQFKKPGKGISVAEAEKVLGRKMNRDVPAGHFLQWQDIEKA